MKGPFDHYGIVHGEKDLFLTEEPIEIECGVYVAEGMDSVGNKHEVELEGWGDGDYDLDSPLDID